MEWLITYTQDYGQTRQQTIVSANSYTMAYLEFIVHNNGIILEINKI